MIFMERAIKKTITYRLSVLIGSGFIFLGSYFLVNNPAGAIVGGFVISEAYRSGIYYYHEKWYEKELLK
jgi:hypothetical protein